MYNVKVYLEKEVLKWLEQIASALDHLALVSDYNAKHTEIISKLLEKKIEGL